MGREGQVLYDKPQLGLGRSLGGSLRLPRIPRLEDNLEISGLPGCGGQTWEVGMAPHSGSGFRLASEKVAYTYFTGLHWWTWGWTTRSSLSSPATCGTPMSPKKSTD